MTAVRSLETPPALGPLYARAVLSGPRRHGSAEPDDRRLTVAETRADPEHLAEYQRVCGFRVSDVLPPTYLHLLSFPLSVARMTESDFPFPLLGLVHVRNVITQSRPVRSGERVALEAWAGDLRPHPSGRQIDLVSQASVDGETVWTETSTYLRRGTPSEPRPTVSGPRPVPAAPVGPVAQWTVPSGIGRRYAAVSGDRNPIHLHPLTARAFGFRRAIAHGMWTKARALASFEGRLPGAFTVDVAFKTPVYLPSRVELVGSRRPDGWSAELHNARSGTPHLTMDIVAMDTVTMDTVTMDTVSG